MPPAMEFFPLVILGSRAVDSAGRVQGENVRVMKSNTEALWVANEEAGLEVSAEKAKHMLVSLQESVGKNHVKCRWNSGDMCCRFLPDILFGIWKRIEIKMYRTVIFYFFLCGCKKQILA